MNNLTKTLAVILCFLSTITVYAQEKDSTSTEESKPSGQILDKIIAKVDNYIILESDLQKSYLEAISQSQQGFEAPSRCEVFESLLVNKLMLAKAEIDSVIVTEDRKSVV